jgi:hypothetical protein
VNELSGWPQEKDSSRIHRKFIAAVYTGMRMPSTPGNLVLGRSPTSNPLAAPKQHQISRICTSKKSYIRGMYLLLRESKMLLLHSERLLERWCFPRIGTRFSVGGWTLA